MEQLACDVSDFADDDRVKVTLGEREVAIFQRDGKYYAMDTYCYHKGGALHAGDIEDIDGRPCVKCPKHRYRICLDNGERLKEIEEGENITWESKGVRQRTHALEVRDGKIYVTLSDLSTTIQSDSYNGKNAKK